MASLVTAPASLARMARPIYGEDEVEQILDLLSEARIVMLGAASYGTHEHYDLRSSLTRKLIDQRGFAGVVIEADWPDALRVDRYVRNQSDDEDAAASLAAFDHFPAWAWRNEDVAQFIEWLHIQNCCRRAADRVGFYGLDLYSLNAAIRSMRSHVDANDDELLAELVDMQWRHAARSGRAPSGAAWLNAIQGAVRDVEGYFRTLLVGGNPSWNLRSVHMADTIDMLAKELGSSDRFGKLVVWAHDAHVGDARATLRGEDGCNSLGQIMRERHGDQVALVGFTTYAGTVRCAREWHEPGRVEALEPARPASWEAMFHETGLPRFMITSSALKRAIGEYAARMHRSVGAIQRAQPYVETRLAEQFDLVVHVDTTRAVEPLVEGSAAQTHAMTDVSACAD